MYPQCAWLHLEGCQWEARDPSGFVADVCLHWKLSGPRAESRGLLCFLSHAAAASTSSGVSRRGSWYMLDAQEREGQ